MRLELFPFRYRDELTGKWKRARYVAERHVIAERFAEFEIIGPPEIREVDADSQYFNPLRRDVQSATIGNLGLILTCIPLCELKFALAISSRHARRRRQSRACI